MENMASNSENTEVEKNTEIVKPSLKKVSKTKIQRSKSSHPPTSEMVTAAIKDLKDRKGSSVQAIKKYIVATYKVDSDKVTALIKRYLKTAVSSGSVVQTKGKGASGSFKLSTVKSGPAKPKTQHSPIKKKASDKSTEKKIVVTNKTTSNNKKSKSPKAEAAKKPVDQKKAKAASPKSKPDIKTTAAAATVATAIVTTAKKNVTKKPTKVHVKPPAVKTRTPKPRKVTTKVTVKK